MIQVVHSSELADHLRTFEVDGATVESALFSGGRLSYPERRHLEYSLGFSEPYLIEHESRVIQGMSDRWNAACRFLARVATRRAQVESGDPTLDLLWSSHDAYAHSTKDAGPPAIDRLIAALVTVEDALRLYPGASSLVLFRASEVLVRGLMVAGFPPSSVSLEEISDGALPACVGLNLIDIDWSASTIGETKGEMR